MEVVDLEDRKDALLSLLSVWALGRSTPLVVLWVEYTEEATDALCAAYSTGFVSYDTDFFLRTSAMVW